MYEHDSNNHYLGPKVIKHGSKIGMGNDRYAQICSDQKACQLSFETFIKQFENRQLHKEIGDDNDLSVDNDDVPEVFARSIFLD